MYKFVFSIFFAHLLKDAPVTCAGLDIYPTLKKENMLTAYLAQVFIIYSDVMDQVFKSDLQYKNVVTPKPTPIPIKAVF